MTPRRDGLSGKEARFVAEFVKEHNGTQAAIRSGYSRKSAHMLASRLLKKVKVQDAIAAAEAKLDAEDEAYHKELRRQVRWMATSDLGKLLDHRGNILPVHEWPVEARASVASIEVVMKNARAGDGVIDRVLKVKLWNKNDATRLDYEAHGLTKPKDPNEGLPDVPAFILPPGSKVRIT